MAKENLVLLYGRVAQKKTTTQNGVNKKVALAVDVMRRPYVTGNGEIVEGKMSIDIPVVISTDRVVMKVMDTLEEGDMVEIRGVLTTRETKKSSICPECGEKNTLQGVRVFVTAIYVCPREKGMKKEEAINLLRQRSEVSNLVLIIGTLCRDPQMYTHETGYTVTQYQIASNRRYHIRDGHDAETTDYPWVKTVKNQAKSDNEHLRMGSTILINGAIQTREIVRTITCESCGAQYEGNEKVTELAPYAVEYLMNCHFDEKEDSEDDSLKNTEATAMPEAAAN